MAEKFIRAADIHKLLRGDKAPTVSAVRVDELEPLIIEAADEINDSASMLMGSHTVNGEWRRGDKAKREYDYLIDLAKRLRALIGDSHE